MAKYKYLPQETGDARFLNRFVEPGEIVEIPDEVAVQYDFSPEVWQEITPAKKAAAKKPARKRAAKKAPAKKAAAPEPVEQTPEPVVDTPAVNDNTNDEE